MNANTMLVLLTGLCVRLAVPLAITALVVLVLRGLDNRWQAEAESERKELVKSEMPCWKETKLSREEFKLGAETYDLPCWQVRRSSNGYLRDACLECDVFLAAPIAATKPSHAQS